MKKKTQIDAVRNLKAVRIVKAFMTDLDRDAIFRKHRELKGLYSTGLNETIMNAKKINGKFYFNVRIDGLYNLVDGNCNVLSDIWFSYIDIFWGNKFTRVALNRKFNYIGYDGKLLYKRPYKDWFDVTWNFTNGFGTLMKNRKENYIDSNGKILSKTWFKFTLDFGSYDGIKKFAVVINKKDKYALIKKDGTLLPINGKKWFAHICPAWIKNGDDYTPCFRIRTKADTSEYILIGKDGKQIIGQEFYCAYNKPPKEKKNEKNL